MSMGFWDWLTGSKPAKPGVAQQSPQDLREAVLALNRDTAPYLVRDGAPEGVDLVAEWKIVDARWYVIFAKANLTRVFKVLIKIDAEKGEVRSMDQEWAVEWRAGVPNMMLSLQGFKGQKKEVSFGSTFAFTEQLEFGQVYNYRFNTGEIKKPLQDAVTSAGWNWHGVAFGKL
jgi:hypothetical protein